VRLAIVAGPAPGHAFPAAALAQGLVSRGHEVLVLTGELWLAALARDGLRAQCLPILSHDERDSFFGFRIYGRGAQSAPGLAELVAAFSATAIVVDTLTVGGAYAAGLLGLPWIELIPHPLQDVTDGICAPGTGLAPGRGPAGRARDTVLRALNRRAIDKTMHERWDARRSLGLPDEGPPTGRVVATLPGFEIPRADWPRRTAVVGPLEWDPVTAELPLPPGDAPLVFASASTAPEGATGILEASLSACEVLGYRLVCTQFDTHDGPLPGWASVGPGRQAPALDAADVVVAGGGHGMVAKAMLRGLPLACVPGGGEQYDNAQRVRRLGAGASIRPKRLTAARLATQLSRLVGDASYGRAARRIAVSAAGLGPAHAARVVERMLGT